MSNTNKSNSLSRKELYDLVWSTPISQIIKEYPISMTAFKKVCIDNDIPLPKNGHWSKLKHNKKVVIIPLPESDKESNDISLSEKLDGLSELNLLIREIKNEKSLPLKVPEKLTKPDKLIISARKDIKNGKVANDWDYKGFYTTSEEEFDIFVHKDTVKRALNFSNTLIQLLKKRGHKIVVKTGERYNEKGTRLIINGEAYKICVRETRKRIKAKSDYSNYMITGYVHTGILTLRIEDLYNHQWSDSTNKKIEDKLPNILAYLELRANKEKIERIEREIRHKENERKRKIEEELKVKRNKELEDFKSVINHSSRWQKAMDLRNYIQTVESNAIKNKKLTQELKDWLQWINDKADWYDPLIEKEDELFEDVDRDTLEMKGRYW